MAAPIPLSILGAWALVDQVRRPEINDVVTIAVRDGGLAFEIDASVVAFETGDEGEVAILADDIGCRWEMPILPTPDLAG